jgi:tetratricopeptide (TPR) repeat protein/TolB-like protein
MTENLVFSFYYYKFGNETFNLLMSSLIEGYNYDIFISYRQKDNKGDRWVSGFVEALMTELESTFKEEISVYFDINPHDGLLETHDVDASLEEKLKCLIFIPVISRTYCDPKSFAWEHEFKSFVEMASNDQFGLKVKLPNGNVASRVLPVRIHDLDSADTRLCESVTGGVLRGIEFIYREPGVNKPLTPDDDEKRNLNRTKYRIQINKTANAVKEIIQGLSSEPAKAVKEKDQPKEPVKDNREQEKRNIKGRPVNAFRIKILIPAAIVALLLVAGTIAWPKIFKRDTLERLRASGERISVAVMPFQNMTNDTTWNVWQNGIQELLVTDLGNTQELAIRQTESVNRLIQGNGPADYASLTPSLAGKISKKINADVFIYGNVMQSESLIRVNAQLIDSKSEEVFKTFQIDGTADKIIQIVDSLFAGVRNSLILTRLGGEVYKDYQKFASTSSPEAYRYFIIGQDADRKGDYPVARNMYMQSLAVDSNFVLPRLMLALTCWWHGPFDQGREWCMNIYEKKENMPILLQSYANFVYAGYFENPYEQIKYSKRIQEIDSQSPGVYTILGHLYYELHQYDKAIPEFEKALNIYEKWKLKPWNFTEYRTLGFLYHATGQYNEERKLYRKAERDFYDESDLFYRQSVLLLSQGRMNGAYKYCDKFKSALKENSASEAQILARLGDMYSEANLPDSAEVFYRQALFLEPDEPARMNRLAWFMFDKNRNLNEGMELIEKALEVSPDTPDYLDTKGYGLYKMGRNEEALALFEKSWNKLMRHVYYYHIELAKRAIAEQRNK